MDPTLKNGSGSIRHLSQSTQSTNLNGVSMLETLLNVCLLVSFSELRYIPSLVADGVKMKISQCVAGLLEQTWQVPAISPDAIALNTGDWCLDLTNGNTTNRNVLQVWTCTGDNNQMWSFTNV